MCSGMGVALGNSEAFRPLSGAAGIRPGIYAGSGEAAPPPIQSTIAVPGPFTGLSSAGSLGHASPADAPVRGLKPSIENARERASGAVLTLLHLSLVFRPREPGMNAGSITACGGKAAEAAWTSAAQSFVRHSASATTTGHCAWEYST